MIPQSTLDAVRNVVAFEAPEQVAGILCRLLSDRVEDRVLAERDLMALAKQHYQEVEQ